MTYEFRTQPGLWRWYDQASRQLAFRAQSLDEAEQWQVALCDQIAHLLGAFPTERCDLTPTLLESVAESGTDEGFQRDLFVLQTQPGEFMPVYVLTPTNAAPPYKPILALHGHGTWGAKSLVGIADCPAEAQFIATYHQDFARKLAQQGYLVFAPVLRAFAERMEDRELALQQADPANPDLWSCAHLSLNALMSGKTLMGLRVWDVTRLIDFVQSRADLLPGKLACVGFSGGGTLTMYSAALDPRITCAYVSSAINSFRASIMSIDHCLCNYVPHLLEYAEMGEVAGLIAPRPLVVEGGAQDPIYPVAGTEQAGEILREIYARLGVPDRFTLHIFDGAHRWDGTPLNNWLGQYLG